MKAPAEMTTEERDRIFGTLTEEQRDFLNHEMLRSRRTLFAQKLAEAKGAMIPEDASYEDVERLLDGWVYTGYKDAGEPSPEYPCECGRPLRYQHEVRHKMTGAIMHFGIKHLGDHLELDAKTVALIIKGFDVLDEEMNEILLKHKEGWTLEDYAAVPVGLMLPKDIKAHLELELPLLDRQLLRLRRKIREFMDAIPGMPVRRPPLREEPAPAFPGGVVEEEAQASFDFFLAEEPAESLGASGMSAAHKGHETSLAEGLKPKVKELLRSGTKSARVIAEILVRDSGTDRRKYSTGKPHLYVPVCIYIEAELAASGQCRLESGTTEDRRYEWVGNAGW
jgi:hypothetical protein